MNDLLAAATARAKALRHHLHTIPELAYQEVQTAAAIRAQLRELNISCTEIPSAPTATIAHIGDLAKPCVALRADIDALPIDETTNLPYRSRTPGQMHACGHDGHTANLIGLAHYLKAIEATLPVCVKLIFQPAEEVGGGAERLVNAGVLDGRVGPRPRVIFGLHGWPGLDVGLVATRPGALMAATDNFLATFIGRGAHGAYPHLARDPIVASAEAILSLQQIISRETDPIDCGVVTVGRISGGSAPNIIPSTAQLEGTTRALRPETRQHLRNAVGRRLHAIAAANELQLDLVWTEGYPPTINDPRIAAYVETTVRQKLATECTFIPAASASMAGEDFAYYLEKVPGCFIVLGLRATGADSAPGLHHCNFNYNDDALPIAIRLFSELVLNYSA